MKEIKKVSEINIPFDQRRKEFYADVASGKLSLIETVVAYRYMMGKSQIEFAKIVGVPLKTIRDFEQGHGNPTLKTLEKMLKGSGLKVAIVR